MNCTNIRPASHAANLRFASALVLLLVMALTGCVTRTKHLSKDQIPLKAETITKSALLGMLKARSLAVRTLIVSKSSLKATRMLTSDKIKEYGSKLVGGTIVVERPNQLFLELDYLGTTAVDMVSGDTEYRISAPPRSWFGVAPVNSPVDPSVDFPYNLRPRHILDALFVDGERYIDDDQFTKVVHEGVLAEPDGVHSFYVISIIRGSTAVEDLWFDRSLHHMEVTRKTTYTEDGRIESDVRYSEYEMVDSVPFPKMIVIQRPLENYSLEMKLNKLELNKPVMPEAFVLERPPSADDFDPTTGKVTKRP